MRFASRHPPTSRPTQGAGCMLMACWRACTCTIPRPHGRHHRCRVTATNGEHGQQENVRRRRRTRHAARGRRRPAAPPRPARHRRGCSIHAASAYAATSRTTMRSRARSGRDRDHRGARPRRLVQLHPRPLHGAASPQHRSRLVFTARLVGNRPPAVTVLYYVLPPGRHDSALTGPAPGVLAAVTDPHHDPLTVTVTNRPTSATSSSATSTCAPSPTRPTAAGRSRTTSTSPSPTGAGLTPSFPSPSCSTISSSSLTDRAVVPAVPFTYVCPASDPDGDPLTLQVTGAPQKGTATLELGCFRTRPTRARPRRLLGHRLRREGRRGGGRRDVTIGVEPAVCCSSARRRGSPRTPTRTFPLSVVSGEGTPTVLELRKQRDAGRRQRDRVSLSVVRSDA